jgi:hypothetical protein
VSDALASVCGAALAIARRTVGLAPVSALVGRPFHRSTRRGARTCRA